MNRNVSAFQRGRRLELRASVVAGDWHLWVYENGDRIFLYGVVPYYSGPSGNGLERIEAELTRAQSEIQNELVIIPVVRRWATADRERLDDLNASGSSHISDPSK
jgi:hypothetical protein